MAFDLERFAAKLRGKRAEADLSQQEVAKRAGTSIDTIVKYEKALVVPGAENLCSIAEVLDTTPNELLDFKAS